MQNPLAKQFAVEETFAEFVTTEGGQLVTELLPPENRKKNADFLFRKPSVIAELKCLERETFTPEYHAKLNLMVNEWVRQRKIAVYGRTTINLRTLHSELQAEWLRLLEKPIQQHIVGDANRQIRETKEQLGFPNAKGLLVVVSDGNTSLLPNDVMFLLSHILKKKDEEGCPQYSSIHAIAYSCLNQKVIGGKSPNAPSLFWAAGARDIKDVELVDFLKNLNERWYAFLSVQYGHQLQRVSIGNEELDNLRFVK